MLYEVITKELWGENHPDYLMVLNNIALNYTELKDYEEALKIDTEIVDKRKRLLGQNHPDYLVSLINLAITEFNVGQLDSSSVHYSEYYNSRITSYNVCYTKLLRIPLKKQALTWFLVGLMPNHYRKGVIGTILIPMPLFLLIQTISL